MDAIAVAVGPGSFTGLRIGLAAAEAMAYAWQCGVSGVNTLEGMAWNVPVEGIVLAPVLDAQKGNVYTAFYTWQGGALQCLTDVRMLSGSELLRQAGELDRPVLLLGECLRLAKRESLPQNVTVAAERKDMLSGEGLFRLRPFYYRKSEAEELWEKKHPAG